MVRARQRLGKYRIERKLGEGGFAAVYRALDTIEGVHVALKVPFASHIDKETLEDFRKEIRLVAQLQHPNILPLKNAELIDGQFVVAFPLGEQSLAERLQYRLSAALALSFTQQILDAVAFAHTRKIIHCDIKPENLILFPDNRLLLTDFGIAKVARKTVQGSGSGTVGYVAPEQAMGRPSFRSDVFSVGLIAYRMFSGHWPQWPFSWPPPGMRRVREHLHADMIDLLRRSLEVEQRKRYRDAAQMLTAFSRLRTRAIRRAGAAPSARRQNSDRDWRTLRFRQFRKQFGQALLTNQECSKCRGPVSEPMQWCPWCGVERNVLRDDPTVFPQCCPRCRRGMKLDWHYCPWCYGPGFEPSTAREYPDSRYEARCSNKNCKRKDLMPFMRYCPWCRRKVRRKWKLPESNTRCSSCGWGVTKDYWNHCAWCGAGI